MLDLGTSETPLTEHHCDQSSDKIYCGGARWRGVGGATKQLFEYVLETVDRRPVIVI